VISVLWRGHKLPLYRQDETFVDALRKDVGAGEGVTPRVRIENWYTNGPDIKNLCQAIRRSSRLSDPLSSGQPAPEGAQYCFTPWDTIVAALAQSLQPQVALQIALWRMERNGHPKPDLLPPEETEIGLTRLLIRLRPFLAEKHCSFKMIAHHGKAHLRHLHDFFLQLERGDIYYLSAWIQSRNGDQKVYKPLCLAVVSGRDKMGELQVVTYSKSCDGTS